MRDLFWLLVFVALILGVGLGQYYGFWDYIDSY